MEVASDVCSRPRLPSAALDQPHSGLRSRARQLKHCCHPVVAAVHGRPGRFLSLEKSSMALTSESQEGRGRILGLDCCFCPPPSSQSSLCLALPLTDWGRILLRKHQSLPLRNYSLPSQPSDPRVLPQYPHQCGSLADAREVS